MKIVSVLLFLGLACVAFSHVVPAEDEGFSPSETDENQQASEDPEDAFDSIEPADSEEDEDLDSELERLDR